MYRLHIDIPLQDNQQLAQETSLKIVEFLNSMNIEGVELVQYRLGNDFDRGNKNYLDIDPQGHCSNKKNKIHF